MNPSGFCLSLSFFRLLPNAVHQDFIGQQLKQFCSVRSETPRLSFIGRSLRPVSSAGQLVCCLHETHWDAIPVSQP